MPRGKARTWRGVMRYFKIPYSVPALCSGMLTRGLPNPPGRVVGAQASSHSSDQTRIQASRGVFGALALALGLCLALGV